MKKDIGIVFLGAAGFVIYIVLVFYIAYKLDNEYDINPVITIGLLGVLGPLITIGLILIK